MDRNLTKATYTILSEPGLWNFSLFEKYKIETESVKFLKEFTGFKLKNQKLNIYFIGNTPTDPYKLAELFNILYENNVKTIVSIFTCASLKNKYNLLDIIVVDDHINLYQFNIFDFLEKNLLPHFFSTRKLYSETLIQKFESIIIDCELKPKRGILMAYPFNYIETYKEAMFFKNSEADVLGNRCAYEALFAKLFNIDFIGVAGIVRNAITSDDISINEIIEHEKILSKYFIKLVSRMVEYYG